MLRDFLVSDTQKALPAGPAAGFSLTGSTSRARGARTARQYLQAYGGDEAIDWVSDCVDLYAQTGSNAEFFFSEQRDPGSGTGSSKPEPVENPPGDLVNLFRAPNPYQDYTELLELAIIDFLVTGEFFWLKYRPGTDPSSSQFGKPLALYRLSPALVDFEFDQYDRPHRVVYNAPGSGEPLKFKPEHVVHVKRPNPHDQWRGLSIIGGGPRVYDIELAVTEAMANYYENGTRPAGVLESDRSVPPSTWEKIKRQFRQLYTTPDAAGATIMLERGLKWSPMSANASDAEFERIAELSMKRIARAFKVPLPLLGETASSTDRQATREAQRIFDNKVMRPFLNRIQSQVSAQLVNAWGLDYFIDYEYVMPIEDKLDLAEAKASLPGVRVKQVLEQVDLPPLEDDEDVPNGKEIDNMVLNLPGEDREDGGHPDRPLGSEAGRPPKGENTRAFPSDGSIPAGAAVRKSLSTEDSAAEIRRTLRVARERLKAVK